MCVQLGDHSCLWGKNRIGSMCMCWGFQLFSGLEEPQPGWDGKDGHRLSALSVLRADIEGGAGLG